MPSSATETIPVGSDRSEAFDLGSSPLQGNSDEGDRIPEVPLCIDSCPLDVDEPLPNTASGSQLRARRLSDSSAASSLSSDNRSLPLRYMSATTDNLGLENRFVPKLSQSNPDIFSYHNQQDPSMTVQFTFGGGALMRQISETSGDGGSGQESRQSNGGNTASGNWGWFEDVHEQDGQDSGSGDKKSGAVSRKGTLLHFAAPFTGSLQEILSTNKAARASIGAVTAPTYVLEESISSQNLWKDTAGTRPPQPVEERAFFERIWTQNFARSQVAYAQPVEVLTATSPISLSPFSDGNMVDGISRHIRPSDTYDMEPSVDPAAGDALVDYSHSGHGQHHRVSSRGNLGPYHHHHTLVHKKVKGELKEELTVLVRGDNVFGTTVSKSFTKNGKTVTVSISIASYRVVESKHHGKYAQFLVIYCEGNFRDTVGVWKRYRDFEQLSRKVTHVPENCSNVLAGIQPLSASDDPPDYELLPNAMTSWKLLKKRQRWYRCLDAGYLSLKVFLLERFLHDILFESSNPDILRDFVGVWSDKSKSNQQ